MNKTELRIMVSQILQNIGGAESMLLREIIFSNDVNWDKALKDVIKYMPELKVNNKEKIK